MKIRRLSFESHSFQFCFHLSKQIFENCKWNYVGIIFYQRLIYLVFSNKIAVDHGGISLLQHLISSDLSLDKVIFIFTS